MRRSPTLFALALAAILAACGDPCPPRHYVTVDGDRVHCGYSCGRYELSPRYEATGPRAYRTVPLQEG